MAIRQNVGRIYAEEITTSLIPYDLRQACFAQHSQLVSSGFD